MCSGFVIDADLVKTLKECFDINESVLWQPTQRDEPDALFARIYYSASVCGFVRQGQRLDGRGFLNHVMTNDADVLKESGLEPNTDDHSWGGVRICRTIAILLRASYFPDASFTTGQLDMVSSILQPNSRGETNRLQKVYSELIGGLVSKDCTIEEKTMNKEGSSEVTLHIPSRILQASQVGFDKWLLAKWGEERGGNKRKSGKSSAKVATKDLIGKDKPKEKTVKPTGPPAPVP